MNRLRYFVAVAETGGIRSAADVLDMTPAALSRIVSRMEDDLGVQLVAPSGRGIRLTGAGEQLALRARRVLEEYAELERAVTSDARNAGVVRLASFEVFTTYFLGEVATTVFENRRVTIISAAPGDVERTIVDGTADIGVTYAPVPTSDVDHLRAGAIEMAVFARAESDLLVEPLATLPFAVPARLSPGALVAGRNADGWSAEIERSIRYRVNAMETALELARRGVAATYLPRFVVELHNEQVQDEFRLERCSGPEADATALVPVFVAHRHSGADEALAHRLVTAIGSITQGA